MLGFVLLGSQLALANVPDSGFYQLKDGDNNCPLSFKLFKNSEVIGLASVEKDPEYSEWTKKIRLDIGWGKTTFGYEDIYGLGSYRDSFNLVNRPSSHRFSMVYRRFDLELNKSKDGIMIKTRASFKVAGFLRPFFYPVVQVTNRLETFVKNNAGNMEYDRYESIEIMKKNTPAITTKLHCEYSKDPSMVTFQSDEENTLEVSESVKDKLDLFKAQDLEQED